jgi:hypothetical protein
MQQEVTAAGRASLPGDRLSVTLGQKPQRLSIPNAGTPGERITWMVAGQVGRVNPVTPAVSEDGEVHGDYVPFVEGDDVEVTCMVGGDPRRTFTFHVSSVSDPDAGQTLRPKRNTDPPPVPDLTLLSTPPGAPQEYEFPDEEVDQLFDSITSKSTRPPPRDTEVEVEPLGARSSVRPVASAVPTEPLREALLPAPVPKLHPLLAKVELAPQGKPTEAKQEPAPQAGLTAEERRSIYGGHLGKNVRNRVVIPMVVAGVVLSIFGMIWAVTSQNLRSGEAFQEAIQRSERFERMQPKVDIGCSNAPLRYDADGNVQMEACLVK